jgi:putative transposase
MRGPPGSRRWNRSARACADPFGGFAANIASGLKARHDSAFVRAPEGNGCAERFIRTLKENLLCVRHFETIEELRQALLAFRETYNETWLIERHGYLTPSQFRQRQLQPVADAA